MSATQGAPHDAQGRPSTATADKPAWTMDEPTARALAMLGSNARAAIDTMMAREDVSDMRLGPYGPSAEGRRHDPRWHGVSSIDIALEPRKSLNATIWFDVPSPGSLHLAHGVLTIRPPLPDTIAAALPGRPATAILDHPLLAGLAFAACESDINGTRATLAARTADHA